MGDNMRVVDFWVWAMNGLGEW